MAPTLAELEAELSRDPKSRRFYELAREYQKQGRMDEAMGLCERGLGNYPSQWQARILLAQLYIGKGRLEEARTMVERVLLPLPDNVPANHLAADIYRALGDSGRALKHYRIVDLLDPGRAGVEERIAELSGAQASATVPVSAVPSEPPAASPPEPAVGAAREEPPAPKMTLPEAEPEAKPSAAGEAEAALSWSEPPAPVDGGLEGRRPAEAPAAPSAPPEGGEALFLQEGRESSGPSPIEEEWLADTAAFGRELLNGEGLDSSGGPLAAEGAPVEETGPLELGAAAGDEAEASAAFQQGEAAEEGLNTATLAELYEGQGFPEKAVEIYQRVLLRDPDNKAVRDKIQALLQKMAGETPEGPAVHQEDVEKALRKKRVVLLQDWLRCVREGSHV
jgi:tetratricopeptide (TPR) repeat protein